jgi:hypothetical protein
MTHIAIDPCGLGIKDKRKTCVIYDGASFIEFKPDSTLMTDAALTEATLNADYNIVVLEEPWRGKQLLCSYQRIYDAATRMGRRVVSVPSKRWQTILKGVVPPQLKGKPRAIWYAENVLKIELPETPKWKKEDYADAACMYAWWKQKGRE